MLYRHRDQIPSKDQDLDRANEPNLTLIDWQITRQANYVVDIKLKWDQTNNSAYNDQGGLLRLGANNIATNNIMFPPILQVASQSQNNFKTIAATSNTLRNSNQLKPNHNSSNKKKVTSLINGQQQTDNSSTQSPFGKQIDQQQQQILTLQNQISQQPYFALNTGSAQFTQTSIQESLITMLQKKCTEMATLADQEAIKRQNVEFSLGQVSKEKEHLTTIQKQLQVEKQKMQQDKQVLQSQLHEQINQNQKLNDHLISQKQAMDIQMQSLTHFQQVLKAQTSNGFDSKRNQQINEINKTMPDLQKTIIAQPTNKNQIQQVKKSQIKLKQDLITTISNDQQNTGELTDTIQTQLNNDLGAEDSQNITDNLQTQSNITQLQDDMSKLRQENKALRLKVKKEEESRKHWQEICKKKDEEVVLLKQANSDMLQQVELEKLNTRRVQSQLAAKNERVKALEKKYGLASQPEDLGNTASTQASNGQQDQINENKKQPANTQYNLQSMPGRKIHLKSSEKNDVQQLLIGKSNSVTPDLRHKQGQVQTKVSKQPKISDLLVNNSIDNSSISPVIMSKMNSTISGGGVLKLDGSKSGQKRNKSVRFKDDEKIIESKNENTLMDDLTEGTNYKPKLFGTGEYNIY
eukprot:403360738